MKKKYLISLCLFCSGFYADTLLAKEPSGTFPEKAEEIQPQNEEPPKTGNFSMPSIQVPGPLISFGENVLDKGQLQVTLVADDFVGQDKYMVDVNPQLIYGLTDKLSLLFSVPFAAPFKDGRHRSSGIEDTTLQLEYYFYSKSTFTYVDTATFVSNMTIPTGSVKKNPPTSFGSETLFFGFTYNRTYENTFFFTSHGVQVPTVYGDSKYGNQFLYQGGLGRNLYVIDRQLIIAAIFEIDGTYVEKGFFNGKVDPNTGGNTILATPSFWLSTQHLTVQLGVGFPIAQHLFGNQHKINYAVTGSLSWLFYK